jgi:predicted MFS family arabinose efflux permease
MTATRIVGPFLAGAIVAVPAFGTGGGYVVMGALMLLVAVTLAKMPPSAAPASGERPSPLADMREGLAHVGSRPRLALLCACFIAVVLAGYSYQVVLPGLLENELGRESSDMAWLLGMAGIAGLAGTVGAAGVAGGSHAWPVQLAGGLSLGVGLLLLAVVPSFGLALPVMLFVGLGSGVFQMLNNALVMQESDRAYYGRVMALVMVAWGVNGLSGLPFGLLADAAGERATMFVMGASVVAVVAGTWVALQLIGGRGIPVQAPVAQAEAAAGDSAAN